MKVTAIIADELVNNVKDWLDIYNVKELNKIISKNPMHIENSQQIREKNRLT
jgi:hypothetical protein